MSIPGNRYIAMVCYGMDGQDDLHLILGNSMAQDLPDLLLEDAKLAGVEVGARGASCTA